VQLPVEILARLVQLVECLLAAVMPGRHCYGVAGECRTALVAPS
jgi:hypothetical protein